MSFNRRRRARRINIEYERLRSKERILVAVCITVFGIVALLHGIDHAVVTIVAAVLGAIIGRRIWLPRT